MRFCFRSDRGPEAVGYKSQFRDAVLRDGTITAVGEVDYKATYAGEPIDSTRWQRLELIRLGDRCLCLLNDRFVGAATDVRSVSDGKEKPFTKTPVAFVGYNGVTLLRNLEIHEIEALPADVLEKTAWRPLFNGIDLAGWKVGMPATASQVLRLEGEPVIQMTGGKDVTLKSVESFENYHLRLQYKYPGGTIVYSKFYFHQAFYLNLHQPGKVVLAGENAVSYHTGYWKDGQLNRLVERHKSHIFPYVEAEPRDGWHDLELYAAGDTVVPVIDGQALGVMANIRRDVDGKKMPVTKGPIALALPKDTMLVRRIEVRPLAEIPDEIKALAGPKLLP